jgi:hypothetical protein
MRRRLTTHRNQCRRGASRRTKLEIAGDPVLTSQPSRQRSVLAGFQRWLHAGEEGALKVYPKRIRKVLLLQCGALAIFLYRFPQYAWPLVIVAIIGFLFTLADGRRAIIFTELEVIYRPPLGSPRRVLISTIQCLKQSVVLVAYMIRASRRPGVTITLKNGGEEVWPLDVEDRDGVLQRFSALTGGPVGE